MWLKFAQGLRARRGRALEVGRIFQSVCRQTGLHSVHRRCLSEMTQQLPAIHQFSPYVRHEKQTALAGRSGLQFHDGSIPIVLGLVGQVSGHSRHCAVLKQAGPGAAAFESAARCANSWIASSECPPSSKKLSWIPTRSTPRTSHQIPAKSSSIGVRVAADSPVRDGWSPPGAGSALRSTLPLGVTGRASAPRMSPESYSREGTSRAPH